MSITINLDLNAIIQKACSAERLQPLLDEAVSESLKCAIEEATGYRSDFRKTLEEQLKKLLPHGLGSDDVVKFQQVLNAAVAKHVNDANATTVQTAFDKIICDAMPDVPDVIKLSELLNEARHGFHKADADSFYAYLEESRYGGHWLYMDENPEPGGSGYQTITRDRAAMQNSAKYRIGINENGEVFSMRFDGKDLTPKSRPDVIGKFAAVLMSMYVGRTKLNVDIDDDDVECAASEDDNQ